MKTKKILSVLIVILILQAQSCGQNYPYLSNQEVLSSLTSSDGIKKPVTVRVIYDNYASVDSLGLKPWELLSVAQPTALVTCR